MPQEERKGLVEEKHHQLPSFLASFTNTAVLQPSWCKRCGKTTFGWCSGSVTAPTYSQSPDGAQGGLSTRHGPTDTQQWDHRLLGHSASGLDPDGPLPGAAPSRRWAHGALPRPHHVSGTFPDAQCGQTPGGGLRWPHSRAHGAALPREIGLGKQHRACSRVVPRGAQRSWDAMLVGLRGITGLDVWWGRCNFKQKKPKPPKSQRGAPTLHTPYSTGTAAARGGGGGGRSPAPSAS